jgi:pimeloyl-ACP methyl ester carboxylesterase
MGAFAQPLADAGFEVIAFDAPGHGTSSGRQSSLPHFAWALRHVAGALGGDLHGVIGHSAGCAAATLAMHDGLRVKRAVFCAPPLHPADYTRVFGTMFGLGKDVIDALHMRIEERFLRKWEDYSLARIAPRMSAALLVIHDRGDDDTVYEGGARLAELWPGAQLMTTEGLGHRRILREPATVQAAVAFVRGERPA